MDTATTSGERRTYSSVTNATRAARAAIGKDAVKDKDFRITAEGDEFGWEGLGQHNGEVTAARGEGGTAGDGMIEVTVLGGGRTRVSVDNPHVWEGTLYPNRTRMREAQRLAEEAASRPPAAARKATTAKAKDEPEVAKAKAKGKPADAKAAPPHISPTREKTIRSKAKANPDSPAAEVAKGIDARKGKGKAETTAAPPEKGQTKQDMVEAMLRRKPDPKDGRQLGGATLEEICEATGWQKHSARGFIAGNLKKRGFEVLSLKEGPTTRYSIA